MDLGFKLIATSCFDATSKPIKLPLQEIDYKLKEAKALTKSIDNKKDSLLKVLDNLYKSIDNLISK